MDHPSSAPVLLDPGHQHDPQVATGRIGDLAVVPDADPSIQRFPLPVPSAPEAPSTCLAPGETFPTSLAELGLTELQVLHSRVTRQLDREYRTDPSGPHPVTLDRAEELADELDTRQEFLEPTALAGTPARPGARAGAAASTGTPGTARAGRLPSPAPRRHDGRLDELFRRRGGSIGTVDVVDPDRLQPGDELEVWQHDQLQSTVVVEQAASALGVLWIREAVDGYRRMLSTSDVVLRYRLRSEPR
jgi:hypothetical protein